MEPDASDAPDRPGQGWVLVPRAQPGHDRASVLPTAACRRKLNT